MQQYYVLMSAAVSMRLLWLCFVFAAVWSKQGEVLHAEWGVRDDRPSWTGIQKVRETAWHDAQQITILKSYLIYDEDESDKKYKNINQYKG